MKLPARGSASEPAAFSMMFSTVIGIVCAERSAWVASSTVRSQDRSASVKPMARMRGLNILVSRNASGKKSGNESSVIVFASAEATVLRRRKKAQG
ncbi:hypothetical protein [Pseudomonas fluorescens]|uniref:hypothetical protein n=1 Tax=Pseudomonas TaxID=286 RepID=UPI003D04543B